MTSKRDILSKTHKSWSLEAYTCGFNMLSIRGANVEQPDISTAGIESQRF
jgi:hypothetical protein